MERSLKLLGKQFMLENTDTNAMNSALIDDPGQASSINERANYLNSTLANIMQSQSGGGSGQSKFGASAYKPYSSNMRKSYASGSFANAMRESETS